MMDIPTLHRWIEELIESGDVALLREILGASPEMSRQAINYSGKHDLPLIYTLSNFFDEELFSVLLDHGLDVLNSEWSADTASDPRLRELLLEAGAPSHAIHTISRPKLNGVSSSECSANFRCTPADYIKYRNPRFGVGNAQRMNNPYWLDMVRRRDSSYSAREHFAKQGVPNKLKHLWDADSSDDKGSEVVWCANRLGQSWTVLKDGRTVEVGGEHDDYYDPDFCIYNDVFVHQPDGSVTIYGYSPTVFPPTDFHSATLLVDRIYIIGSLGYPENRTLGSAPVYELETRNFSMRRISTKGQDPGWIHGHAARAVSAQEIMVWGGKRLQPDGELVPVESGSRHVLDLSTRRWRRV